MLQFLLSIVISAEKRMAIWVHGLQTTVNKEKMIALALTLSNTFIVTILLFSHMLMRIFYARLTAIQCDNRQTCLES